MGGASENDIPYWCPFCPSPSKLANGQSLFNILLKADERQLVVNKANEEVQYLYQENPKGMASPAEVMPSTEPSWNLNSGKLALIECYKRCMLEGLKKGVPKRKSLNMIKAVEQKPNEYPSEFLERIYHAYRKHTDADLQVPQTVRVVNMTFIGQGIPDTRII